MRFTSALQDECQINGNQRVENMATTRIRLAEGDGQNNLNASLQKRKSIKMMAVKQAAVRIAGPSYVGARHCLEKLHTQANEWNVRQRAECYHADVAVHTMLM